MIVDINPSLYFIADPACCGGRDVADVVMAAVEGGAGLIQYRNKMAPRDVIAAEAAMLVELLKPYNIPLIINDHPDIAHSVGAAGAHIGQGDICPDEARKILGPDAILGLTAFTEAQIADIIIETSSRRKPGSGNHHQPDPAFQRDDSYVVDYIGTGPVYPTKTDKGKPVLGLERFAELAALSPVPVIGIGGITAENAASVIEAGAAGVAVMRAIGEAEDPKAAAGAFFKP